MNQPLHAGEARSAVTGTVSYLVRIAPPPDAIIQVQLQDVSRDAPATTIAEDKIKLGQRQVPVPFELRFNPTKIDPHHTYAIDARIVVEDQLLFINDRTYRVLTQGNPSRAR